MKYYLVIIVFIGLKILFTKQTAPTTVTLTTSDGTANYAMLYPQTNTANVRVFSLNVILQTNVTGKWRRPNSTEVDSNSITFPTFTLINAGLYTFYVNNNETIRILITATGFNFAMMASQGNYIPLLNNEIFYTDTTLVCATSDTSQQIEWTYQPDQTATARTTSSRWDASTGISTLEIMTSEQGYYSCQAGNLGSYDAAIFDPENTIVITAFGKNYYLRGIDPTDILLLCDLNNTNIPLKDILMTTQQPNTSYNNPIILKDLNQIEIELICAQGTSSQLSSPLSVIEPVFASNYSGMSTQTCTTLSPSNINLNIPLYSTQVQLTTNLGFGSWHTPLSTLTDTTHTIQTLTLTSQGRYTFNTTQTWNGDDRQIFIIDITATGTPFAVQNSAGDYIPKENNEIFYSDTKLVCLTDFNTAVSWFFQDSTLESAKSISSTDNNINMISEGISILTAAISSQGFYSCNITNNGTGETYTAGVFKSSTTTTLQDGMSYVYTLEIDSPDTWVLCDPQNSSMDLRFVYISNSDGLLLENFLKINNFRSYFNTTQSSINCFYKIKFDTFLSASLYIQGPPTITILISAEYATTYTLLPPSTNTASVRVLSQNVTLQANLIGKWRRPDNTEVDSDTITFPVFTANHAGLYRFYVTNWKKVEVLAIQIILSNILSISELTLDGDYQSAPNNEIFYRNTTLMCATSNTSKRIQWTYRPTQIADAVNITSQSDWNAITGISVLENPKPLRGYYRCEVKQASYDVAIFYLNEAISVERPMSGASYYYIKEIDPSDILLLCDLNNPAIPLDSVMWRYSEVNYTNPIKLNNLNATDAASFSCLNEVLNDSRKITLTIYEPSFTLSYDGFQATKYDTLSPAIITLTLPLFSTQVLLSTNFESGIWEYPDSRLVASSNITIPFHTLASGGTYSFNTNLTWDRRITKVFTLNIITSGSNIAVKHSSGYFPMQNNTFGENNTQLACFTSYQGADNSSIQWYYQETVIATPEIEDGYFDPLFGVRIIYIVKPGIYTCHVPDHRQQPTLFSVGIIVPNNTTIILSEEDLDGDDEMTYTVGGFLTLLYQDPNIGFASIRWTSDEVKTGDANTPIEFLNPVDASDVFAQLGSGAYTFSCFYRQSPITVVGNINLNLRDTAFTKLTYDETSEILFSDVNNANFPQSQTIDIPILTENIKLTCDTSMCEWLMERDAVADYSISDSEYIIDVLKIENQGLYSLRRKTSADVTYSTARFMLTVTGFTRQSIISLNHSDINLRPITLFWELETVLPFEANERFTVSYVENGESYERTTTDTTFSLTDLIPGQTYTVYVTLSYAYTYETSNRYVVIMLPSLPQVNMHLVAIIPALFLMIVLVLIFMLLIIIIFKMKKRKSRTFTILDENNTIANSPNNRNTKYTQLETLRGNPVYTELMDSVTEDSTFSETEPMMQEAKINYPQLSPIPLNMFKGHVDQLWEKEKTLEEEYNGLGGDSFRYTCDKAQIEINKSKNKYKFVYPYDKSRVVLKKEGRDAQSDYINASHIPGLYVPQCFIASQGPKERTLGDFWRMIFEQNIVNIVMVTNLIEGGKKKCEAYFPSYEGEQFEYGPYKLTNIQTDLYKGYITRMLEVECNNEQLQIKHFHFTAWPDHDVPTLYDELLVFVETVQETMIPSKAPILVHCSAGVGRTGTFITLFNLRSAISRKQPISIYEVVYEMREHRPHMVQAFRQYKFIYLAVLELLLGKTSIPAEDFTNTYNSYLESDQEGYVSVFFQQFSELNYLCKKSFYLPTDAADNNPDKNPSGEIVPFDHNRVVINSPFFPCNYINASYHEGNQFITTIHPDANTLVDFLQMVYQTEAVLVVMLATSEEKSEILGNMSDRKAYWPNKGACLNVPPFEVSVTNSEEPPALMKQTILLKNNSEQAERTFMQVISTAWNEKGETTDLQSTVVLLDFIIKYKHENPSKPIIIHCQDGIGKTGIMYTVYQCIREMKEKGQIDIFHTIKRLRRERINFVPTLTHFCSCFAVMNEYCSST